MHDKPEPDPATRERQRRLVLDALPVGEVARDAAVTVVHEIARYHRHGAEQVQAELMSVLTPVLAMLREARDASPGEREAFAAFGALRAQQGIGLEPFLEATRLTTRRAFDALYARARTTASPEVGMELLRDFWAACDQVSAEMIQGHRERELAHVQAAQEQRTLLLWQLLTGELPAGWLPSAATALGLDLRAEYRVCHARPDEGHDVAAVERALRPHTVVVLAEPGAQRVIALADGRPPASFGLPSGVGEPRPLARLRESLAQAERGSELAAAFGLRRCVSPDELPLHSAVLTLPQVGERLAERCFGHTSGERRATLVRTVDVYLAADANADRAAAALFVHPNTLRYRIRGLTATTGLDPARTEDALALWWAVRHLEARDHGAN
ncbi:PucR family transcriptional regulator [Streptomyces echinatus]|uniref:PucR family transcriptional regulator n=1 Tax=Streptomyces echinatus TaxID=67293 RepID=UPI0038118817